MTTRSSFISIKSSEILRNKTAANLYKHCSALEFFFIFLNLFDFDFSISFRLRFRFDFSTDEPQKQDESCGSEETIRTSSNFSHPIFCFFYLLLLLLLLLCILLAFTFFYLLIKFFSKQCDDRSEGEGRGRRRREGQEAREGG